MSKKVKLSKEQLLGYLTATTDCLDSAETAADKRRTGRELMSSTNAHVQTTLLSEIVAENGQEKPNLGQRMACNMFSLIDGIASGFIAMKKNAAIIDNAYGEVKVKQPAPNQTEVRMEGAPS